MPRVSGATGNLARENAKRNPRRTAATASALMIGVFLVGFITILATSTKASTAAAVDESLRADYVVDSGSWGEGGFGPTIEDELAAAARGRGAVAAALHRRRHRDRRPREVLRRRHRRPSTSSWTSRSIEGSITDVHGNGIAMWADDAIEHGLALGDTVTLTFAGTGDVELTVQALYDGERARRRRDRRSS